MVGESRQAVALSPNNPFALRPPRDGGQGWLAAQWCILDEQQKQKGMAKDMNRRLARIENMLVRTRDEGVPKIRTKLRHRRKDEDDS